MIFRTLVPVVIGLLLTGCNQTPEYTGLSLTELKPETVPGKSQLILSGHAIPVELETAKNPPQTVYFWKAHGETIDTEIYELYPDRYKLRAAVSEGFDPPIVLVQNAISQGQSWNWKGEVVLMSGETMLTGDNVRRPAEATVAVQEERINVLGGPYDAFRVTVNLKIMEGARAAKPRKLQFWFVKGKGLVKRVFDETSTREPAP